MASLLSIKGEVVIVTDVSSNAERVADGVEAWLQTQQAPEIHRVPAQIEFRGNPVYMTRFRWRVENPKASLWGAPGLRGLRTGVISFEKHADKVIIRFEVMSDLLDLDSVLPLLAVAAVLGRISLFLPVPLFIAGVVAHLRLTPKIQRRYFERELTTAAIRGLADGAAAELLELRAKSASLASVPAVS